MISQRRVDAFDLDLPALGLSLDLIARCRAA